MRIFRGNRHTAFAGVWSRALLYLSPFVCIVALSLPRVEAQEKPAQAPSPSGALAAALKQCLQKESERDPCLDSIFREFLKTHSTSEALSLIQNYENSDADLRLACHPLVHAIGRETFRLKGNVHDAFGACDQTCHSGCYHGSVERFLRGEQTSGNQRHVGLQELKRKVSKACDPETPVRVRFQCLHGLGHAIMFFADYQLKEALNVCDVLADDWNQRSCYGGVFMENVFSATPQKGDLSPSDYHYPCNRLDQKYRDECYLMQTWRMSEMGLSTSALFDECKKAGAHQIPCTQSIGRDLSNEVRLKEPRLTAEHCETVQGEHRQACVRGVIYALIDNTWDGRYALPFCAALRTPKDIGDCFGVSREYLTVIVGKSASEIADECAKYSAGQSQTCLASFRR
ncbi:MAG TPA: hypothetical protein VE689_01745 [Candidatus Udaeobacter sp.]|jgi:hypothetical protein|nr:hypothetical protein [Candidatus Udaeobacter sp.]